MININAKTYKCFYLYFVLFFFISNGITLATETSAPEYAAQNHQQDNLSSTSTYIKEKILNVYQIGVIKGENIPDKCIFSKFAEAWGLKYKKESLYAILSVTNIHNNLVTVRFSNPPYKLYWHDFWEVMDLAPGETIYFFIEIDNSSPIAEVLTYHGNMTISLDANAPLVDWDTVLSPSSENASLTITQRYTYDYPGAHPPPPDVVLLQVSLFSRCKFPLYFTPQSTKKESFHNISLTTGKEDVNSSNLLCVMFFERASIKDGFLLLPGEHIILSNTMIDEKRNDGLIINASKKKILNKQIKATWIHGIYSQPIFIN